MLIAHFIDESSSSQNIEQERNEQQYRYGEYGENDEENQENEEYMEEEEEEGDEEIVQEDQCSDEDVGRGEGRKDGGDEKVDKVEQQVSDEGQEKVEDVNKSSKYIDNEY